MRICNVPHNTNVHENVNVNINISIKTERKKTHLRSRDAGGGQVGKAEGHGEIGDLVGIPTCLVGQKRDIAIFGVFSQRGRTRDFGALQERFDGVEELHKLGHHRPRRNAEADVNRCLFGGVVHNVALARIIMISRFRIKVKVTTTGTVSEEWDVACGFGFKLKVGMWRCE